NEAFFPVGCGVGFYNLGSNRERKDADEQCNRPGDDDFFHNMKGFKAMSRKNANNQILFSLISSRATSVSGLVINLITWLLLTILSISRLLSELDKIMTLHLFLTSSLNFSNSYKNTNPSTMGMLISRKIRLGRFAGLFSFSRR